MSELIQIFAFLVLIFSIVIHEFSHGWMADQLGDSTARYMGRLTLNPIAHIDLVGSVLLPLFLYLSHAGFIVGWAKPVPYNPYNLKDQRKGPALVALAGPAANLTVAVVFGILVRLLSAWDPAAYGEAILLFSWIIYYNILLAIFNLVPIPPLDGSKILTYLLPRQMSGVMEVLEKNSILFLLLFIFFGFDLILPIIDFLFNLLIGGAALM